MIGNWLRVALFCFLLGGYGCCSATANAQTLVLLGGSVYASPDAAPLPDAVVVISGGVITAIGSRSDVRIPPDARVIDCTGKTVVAGFWNSHVHFTQAGMEKRRQRTGGAAGRTYAGDADPVGFHHRVGPGFRPERTPGLSAGASTPAKCRVRIFFLPAAFSRKAAIPSICRPSCNFPKPPRRTKPRKCRGVILKWASTASSSSPARTWATSRS